jgi:hypothetical protein
MPHAGCLLDLLFDPDDGGETFRGKVTIANKRYSLSSCPEGLKKHMRKQLNTTVSGSDEPKSLVCKT